MLPKKTPTAYLENRRFAYLQVGLVFALAITLAAFQWTSIDVKDDLAYAKTEIEWGLEEDILPTMQERKVEAPKLKQPAAVTLAPVFETIELVDETDPLLEDDMTLTLDDLFDDGDDPWFQEDGCADCEELPPFIVVEDMPHMCECAQYSDSAERADCNLTAMFSHLNETVKVPSIIRDAHITQTAYVRFVIDKDGGITSVNVLNKDKIYEAVSAEAVRAVETMPCWKPGLQRKQPVRVQYTIPIKFIGA